MSQDEGIEQENPQRTSAPAQGDKVANWLTMFGHLCTDINQGAIAAVLPFLVMYDGYSYAAVTMLLLASNLASAIIQPLFGWIGDRKACPWFMAMGVLFAGGGMCALGFVTNYWAVVACALISGMGVAMFHPEGGRVANLAAGERKGNGMSIFAVGGNIGFFVGPIMTATFLSAFGMHGTLVFIFPAVICAAVLLAFNGRMKALGTGRSNVSSTEGQSEHWGKFGLVMVVLILRSIVIYGLMAFIPLFLMDLLGQSESFSSLSLSLFSVAGAVATFLSGRTCEKFGVKRVMIISLLLATAFICWFAVNRVLIVALALTMLLAAVCDVFYPSSVALGMSFVPRHLGTASGLSYGVAMCVGGIVEPLLGSVGDAIGLTPVMLILAAVALAGMLASAAVAAVDRRA